MNNIKDNLQKIDKEYLNLLISVGKTAGENDLKAYLVGGMVRDLLLGISNLDIDITVENDAIKLANTLQKDYSNCKVISTHDRFQTAKLEFKVDGKNINVDLATTREEIYKFPASLPDVEMSTLEKDLIRRDFSINALAISLLPSNFGEVVDLFDGLVDLNNKKIKTLHDKSFIDDPTRMIRAVRFATRLKFNIEQKTSELLAEAIDSGQFNDLINRIRGDRVRIELQYLFNLEDIVGSAKIFFESGICKLVAADLASSSYNSIRIIEKSTDFIVKQNVEEDWIVYFTVILSELDRKKLNDVCESLQFTAEERKIIIDGLDARNKISAKSALDSVSAHHILSGMHIGSILIAKALLVDDSNMLKLMDEYILKTSKIKLEIDGNDLIAQGIPQGAQVGKALRKVLDKKIKNPNMTKEEELKLATAN